MNTETHFAANAETGEVLGEARIGSASDSIAVVRPKRSHQDHDIKLHSKYWMAAETQAKMFEIRKNDRDYQIGDFITLREWDGSGYTGQELHREITYITDYAQQKGYVVIGLTD